MITQQQTLRGYLKEYFGFNAFKENQEDVIKSILEKQDTFVIMPTGGGKSLCYQLPAIISDGTAIIISPLIALMKNQVDMIRAYSSNDEIAHFLNSSLTKAQAKTVKADIASGKTKMLYVAPETLTKKENIDFFASITVSFVAVDEAHCISEWGHDFRPEYRRIREMVDGIGGRIPIMALTATATPKVRSDIVKNLNMEDPQMYISSFLRENLYYEVKPKGRKTTVIKDIVRFIKSKTRQSGIIYCLNRKTTEELAELLNVNGVTAAPYHAGLDTATRTKTQDMFLREDVEVIVATIAFGMGIDKPDVRFVIHFNIPKSLENYYQETGRAGRDGLEGNCIAYYSYEDIHKLEKFLRDKPVAEREIGSQHLMEVSAYAESSACRRQFLLHYFGEKYDTRRCGTGECDNCRHPKEFVEAKSEVRQALRAVEEVNESGTIPYLVNLITGRKSQDLESYGHTALESFGIGKDKDERFWQSILRHALLNNYIRKDIEEYGIIKLTDLGRAFLKKPKSVKVPLNRDYEEMEADMEEASMVRGTALDPQLLNMLKDLRKQVANKLDVPPFVVFQDPSLEDMATQYPISLEEMSKIVGVSQGKAQRYGQEFAELIRDYVEENEIERPQDVTVKSVSNNSEAKVFIIKQIDRKMPLEDIARAKKLSMSELYTELETIVTSGTKLDISYYINDILDEDIQDLIYDYFRSAQTDAVDVAYAELEDEGVSLEEIQVMRMKFLSEMAN
jgi:ATP-dependent DNA helicase RecQ